MVEDGSEYDGVRTGIVSGRWSDVKCGDQIGQQPVLRSAGAHATEFVRFGDGSAQSMQVGDLERKLDISISYSDTTSSSRQVCANQPLAASYLNAVRGLGEALDIPLSVDAKTLSTFPDVLIVEDKNEEVDQIANLIFAALDEALTHLVDKKTEEGERLTSDILAGCANLEELLCQVRDRAKQVPIDYKERLTKRLDELLAPEQRAFFDEQRMAAEVLLFVDKADIHEEMIRLESHLASMREVVRQNLPVGKQLDFFCQEVNREVNTIGSKANDLELTNLTIAMKSGLEKIREQVQNLE